MVAIENHDQCMGHICIRFNHYIYFFDPESLQLDDTINNIS